MPKRKRTHNRLGVEQLEERCYLSGSEILFDRALASTPEAIAPARILDASRNSVVQTVLVSPLTSRATSADISLPPIQTDQPGSLNTLYAHHNNVPDFASHPTIRSVRSGNWSDPATWGGSDAARGAIPGPNDVVQIAAGHTVTVDMIFDSKVTIGVHGTLKIASDQNSQLVFDTMMIYADGTLEGSVNPDNTATMRIVDAPIDTKTDPEQFGHGIIVLGKLDLHGAAKTPEARSVGDILAGQTTIVLSENASGWKVGDVLELPDTRLMLNLSSYSNASPHNQWETVTIANISGNVITLDEATQFDHLASRNATDNAIRFTVPVLNKTRNVVIESENPNGVRGHILALDKASFDLENTLVKDLGRTNYTKVILPVPSYEEHKKSLDNTVLSIEVQSTRFAGLPATLKLYRTGDGFLFEGGKATHTVSGSSHVVALPYHGKIELRWMETNTGRLIDEAQVEGGRIFELSEYAVEKVGPNQVGRYPIHLHHVSGPENPTNTGYQFTISGSVVDNTVATKWGIAIHDSSYGKVSDNIVSNTSHWAILTEDGGEYSNEFTNNYAASHSNASAFYFSGPMNVMNGNVGYNSFAGIIVNGTNPKKVAMIPTVRGAHSDALMQKVEMMNAKMQSFADNEAFGTSMAFILYNFSLPTVYGGGDLNSATGQSYAATVDGFSSWNNLRVTSFYNGDGFLTPSQVINDLTARSDISKSSADDEFNAALFWNGGAEVMINNADIQGFREGIRDRARQGNQVAGAIFKMQVSNSTFANRFDYMQTGNWTQDSDGKRVVFISPLFLPIVDSTGQLLNKTNVSTTAALLEGDMLAPAQIWIKDYNRTGQNLRVYMPSQEGSFVLPSNSRFRIPPELQGLTNEQAWAQYGKAIGGAVTPLTATKEFASIVGSVDVLSSWPAGLDSGVRPVSN